MFQYTVIEIPIFNDGNEVGTYREFQNEKGRFMDAEYDLDDSFQCDDVIDAIEKFLDSLLYCPQAIEIKKEGDTWVVVECE